MREISRVATLETEHEWLALAQNVDMRTLERSVAAARQQVESNSDPQQKGAPSNTAIDDSVRTEWKTPQTLRITFELSAGAWTLLERALEGARRASDASLSDAAALEAVARDAIAHQTNDIDASDPRRAVVVYECRHCKQSELDTGAGLVTLDPAGAATFGCGAPQLALENEGRLVRAKGSLPASIRRAVLLRDHCRCRVPGCDRRRYVDVHHIVEQAQGGVHSRSNCLVLCTTHHRLLHEGKLAISGDAEGEPSFCDADGAPIAQTINSHLLWDERTARGVEGATTEPALANQTTRVRTPATQGGSCYSEAAAEVMAGLLRTMGGRGGWTVDGLIQQSGMAARDVNAALTFLELDGRARA